MRASDRKANAEESNTNVNINYGINPSVKFEKIEDPLEKLQEEIPGKELTTVMKGIYFDSEVWNVVVEQSKRLGRGGKGVLKIGSKILI